MTFRSSAFCVIAVLVVSTVAAAQWDVNGPNAHLTMNGKVPSVADATNHDVTIAVSGTLELSVATNANPGVGLILLASQLDPTGVVLAGLPWGGSIDIGSSPGVGQITNVLALGDGIGNSVNPVTDPFYTSNQGNAFAGTPPEFLLTYAVGTSFAGSNLAFQAIVSDPTAAGFPLDNTEAGDANFVLGQIQNLQTGEANEVTIPFANGNTFNFHGINYTDITVEANGYVTFGGPSSMVASGFNNDHVTWLGDRPSIACAWTHWDPVATSPGDGVLYEELGNQLRIAWGDPSTDSGGLQHFSDTDVNLLEITMVLDDGVDPNEGQFNISTTILDPNASYEYGNGLVGHTPGPATAGGGYDVHLRSFVQVGAANQAQAEEHNNDGANASNLGYDAVGTNRSYNDITINWNGASVAFTPNPPTTTTGDAGYVATPTGPAEPPHATGIGQGSLQAVGQTITISGSFFQFAPTGLGTVHVEDVANPGVPIAGAVLGILDDSGTSGPLAIPNTSPQDPVTLQKQVRDGQGLEFLTPALFGIANANIVVTFETGDVFTLGPYTVTSAGVTFTSYTNNDDGFATHTLANQTLVYYGVTHATAHLCSNGMVTFSAGSFDFTETEAEFFDGWGSPPNPGVGLFYSDLNRGGLGSGATYDVVEDTNLQTVQFQFNNQNHWSSQDPAGSFTATFGSFGPNSVTLDYTNFIPGVTSSDDGIIGVTDGDAATGTDTSHTDGAGTGLFFQLGVLVDPGGSGPNSHCETIPANTAIGATTYNFLGNGLGEFTLF